MTPDKRERLKKLIDQCLRSANEPWWDEGPDLLDDESIDLIIEFVLENK